MPLSAELQALTLPDGTEFPGTMQELLELIAQYMAITGLNPFSGINFGDVEPAADERDRPWFKTDGAGNPIGWFSWNGSAWTAIPIQAQNGGTGSRPTSPDTGQLFFDSDIGTLIIWDGTKWTTASGSPGDVKEVKAATLADALTNNPGWAEDTDSIGRFVIGVTSGTGFEMGDTGGEAQHTLTEDEMPAHTHTVRSNNLQADGNASNPVGIVSGVQLTGESGSAGGGDPHNNIPPYIAYWRIYKLP
jgi:hypothetical protein